jgi:hypothetical protein
MELPAQLAAISFHSVPILLSHALNDGRSTSSNSGQFEIDCGDSHGCCMVSGVISRIFDLLKTIVGYTISGSRNVLSFVVVTGFGSGAGTMLAARGVGSGCRSSYVPLVPFM